MDEKQLWERLTAVEQSNISAHRRMDSIETLTQTIKEMVVELKYMREEMAGMKIDIEKLKEKPLKRMETVIKSIIGAITTGLVGYFIAKLS